MAQYNKKIVAVDDSALILKMLDRVLGKKYNLYAFSDGKRAFEFLRKEIPDLIILDILMPGMSGYDMIQKIKQIDHLTNVPVIFLTSNNDKEHVVKALAAGAKDYAVKPIDEDILLKKVDKLLW